MNINSVNSTTFGMKPIKSIPLHRNRRIRIAKKPKIETVVVLPDGTIERGILAKIRDSIDNAVIKLAEKIIFK